MSLTSRQRRPLSLRRHAQDGPGGQSRARSARSTAVSLTLGLVGAGLLLATHGLAQPRPPPRPYPTASPVPPGGWPPPPVGVVRASGGGGSSREEARLSLAERIGVEQARQLLTSSELEQRMRGVERLAGMGTDDAIDALVGSLAPGSMVRMNAKSRLLAVRALAPHAGEEEAAKVLANVLTSGRSGGHSLQQMAAHTAALALARAGDRQALRPLVAAIIGGTQAGVAARDALLTYPPVSLELVVGKRKKLSTREIALLGDLGDMRAIEILRPQLKRKNTRVRMATALALAKLGDSYPLTLVRKWIASKKSTPQQRKVATEVLVLLGVPDRHRALVALITKGRTRGYALQLALTAPSARLVATLKAAAAEEGDPLRLRKRATVALARTGSAPAARALLGLLATPELATTAAFGLAGMGTAAAGGGLARALASTKDGPARRLILRACLVRYLKLDETVAGLEPALEAAFAAKDPANRAVGSFGLALLRARPFSELIRSSDPAIALAAARASFALGGDEVRQLGGLLEGLGALSGPENPPVSTVAGALSLLVDSTRVPTATLARWAEGGGAVAPVAALELAARDSLAYRERLERMLHGTDPVVRIHVVFGLGRSPEKDAVSLLTETYRFEPDPRVRRAVIRALSVRPERLRLATLQVAAELDPDAHIRALAASALAGHRFAVELPPRGQELVWLTLLPNRESQRSRAAHRPAQLTRPDGLALPVVTAPDGVLLVPGLTQLGAVSVQLAPMPEPAPAPEAAPSTEEAAPSPPDPVAPSTPDPASTAGSDAPISQ